MKHVLNHPDPPPLPPLLCLLPFVTPTAALTRSHLQGGIHPRDARHLLGGQGAPVVGARPRAGQGAVRGPRSRLPGGVRGRHLLHPHHQHLAHGLARLHPAPLRRGCASRADLVGTPRGVLDSEAERDVDDYDTMTTASFFGGGSRGEKEIVL